MLTISENQSQLHLAQSLLSSPGVLWFDGIMWIWFCPLLALLQVLHPTPAVADHRESQQLSRLLGGRSNVQRDPALARVADLIDELSAHPLAGSVSRELTQARAALHLAEQGSSKKQGAAPQQAELAWAYLSLAGRKLAHAHALASYRGAERAATLAEEQARKAERGLGSLLASAPLAQQEVPPLGAGESSRDPRTLAPDFYARAQRAQSSARSASDDLLRKHYARLHKIWLQATREEAARLVIQRKRAQVDQRRLHFLKRRSQVLAIARTQQDEKRELGRERAAAERTRVAYTAWLRHRFSKGKPSAQVASQALHALPVLLDQGRMWVHAAHLLGGGSAAAERRAQEGLEKALAGITRAQQHLGSRVVTNQAFGGTLKALASAASLLTSASADADDVETATMEPCLQAAGDLIAAARSATHAGDAVQPVCDDMRCREAMCSLAALRPRLPACCQATLVSR